MVSQGLGCCNILVTQSTRGQQHIALCIMKKFKFKNIKSKDDEKLLAISLIRNVLGTKNLGNKEKYTDNDKYTDTDKYTDKEKDKDKN